MDIITRAEAEYLHRLSHAFSSAVERKLQILAIVSTRYALFKTSRVRFAVLEQLGSRNDVGLIVTGPGWPGWDERLSLQSNVRNRLEKIDWIIWYKPLSDEMRFDPSDDLPIKTCLIYNEMWDVTVTEREIVESRTRLVICHHSEDYRRYARLNADDGSRRIVHIPHCGDEDVYCCTDSDRDIDILICGAHGKHYPLRRRLRSCVRRQRFLGLRNFRIREWRHPGTRSRGAYDNRTAREFSAILNRSKITLTCSSRHNYELGKYIEIPLCGSVICGDLPPAWRFELRNHAIEVGLDTTEAELVTALVSALERPEWLTERARIGMAWAVGNTKERYVHDLLAHLLSDR